MKFIELFTKLMRERGMKEKDISIALVGQVDYEVTPEEEIAMTKFMDLMCAMPTEVVGQMRDQVSRQKAKNN